MSRGLSPFPPDISPIHGSLLKLARVYPAICAPLCLEFASLAMAYNDVSDSVHDSDNIKRYHLGGRPVIRPVGGRRQAVRSVIPWRLTRIFWR